MPEESRGGKYPSVSVDAGVNQGPLMEVCAEAGAWPLERSCYCSLVKPSS